MTRRGGCAAKRGDRVLATGEALSSVAVVRSSAGALAFRFTRPLAGAGAPGRNRSVTLSPHADALTPLVWGLFPSWSVQTTLDHPVHDDMHTRWSHTPTILDLARGTATGGEGGGLERAIITHGASACTPACCDASLRTAERV